LAFFAPRIAAMVLGLLGPPEAAGGQARVAEVAVAELEVFDQPDPRSVASGTLHQGNRVSVVGNAPAGWLAIAPPADAFRWIEQTSIVEGVGGSQARVVVDRARIRAAIPGARMLGPPCGELSRGTAVQLLDRPPISLGRKGAINTWRAIAPLAGDLHYILADGITWVSDAPPQPAPETKAVFAADAAAAPLAPATAAEIAQIELSHRAALGSPIAAWQLDPIRQRYEVLLRRAGDPASQRAIQSKLDLVARQAEASKSARTFETILERSRQRDRLLTLYLRRVDEARQPHQAPYDAVGLIQPSSRTVDGQLVYALIGPEGTTLAYLDLPSGLDPMPLYAHRVGVRGEVHYDERLRARLIAVQDLIPVDGRR
jgi:hypothetical protein